MSRELIALLLGVAACFDPPPPPGDFVESHIEQFEVPAFPPPDFDLLVVVDDTPAMTPYQAHLAGLANELVAQLGLSYGGIPNMHIAVTTTTSGGALRTTPAMADAYISDALQFDGARPVNYQGALIDVLGSLLAVGTSSASANQPLAAIKSALEAPSGFVRRNAYSAVLVVSASDDASPPADYGLSLRLAYQDPFEIIAGGIYPTASPQLDTFFHSFPNRFGIASIDSVDWSPAYELFGQIFRFPLSHGLRCSTNPADVDPSTPGAQIDCHIAYVLDTIEHPMPECFEASQRPCWKFVSDSMNCPSEFEERMFVVDGFPDPYHPAIKGECVVK